MVLGLKYGQFDENDLDSRTKGNEKAVQFLDEFKKRKGSYICRNLLGCDLGNEEGKEFARANGLFGKICPDMVRAAAEIVSEILENDG